MEWMTVADFLDEVRRARSAWERALAEIPEDRMTEAGVAGDWSVKDLIAHVMWSEREMVGVLKQRALVGSDLWSLTEDERNAAVYEENRHRSLEDVRAEEARVYAELVLLIEALSDDELNSPAEFAQMPPDWLPWQVLRGSTYRHFRDHAEDIHAWWAGRNAR